jgi:hypothetical protein
MMRLQAWRLRCTYVVCAVLIITLGLSSRSFAGALPAFIGAYAGDTLWAMLVFFSVAIVGPKLGLARRACISLCIAYAVEVSQLYHAPWLDAMRHTRVGALFLGVGFLWSDLLCYSIGVALGVVCEWLVINSPSVSGHIERS